MKIDTFISDHVTFRKESLLKSDFEKLQTTLSTRLNDKSVLVIGGAGTIGSSYVKAILKFKIQKLVVVDINEHSMTQLKRDLRSSKEYHRPVEFITYQINFNDRVFEDVFLYQGPFDIVANFAQLKHLANENDLLSVETIIENNIFRTRKLLELLYETPPKHFFCISPAMRVNPFSIMSAGNKLLEDLIMAYSDRLPIITARLANVAFSNGSLLSGFLERFNKKQHLTCPIGVSRSYISPKESGEFCLIATIMGESGDIFFPKLDESGGSITFDQIAIDLIRSQGFEPDVCHSAMEAKRKALMLNDQSAAYPVYFFETDTSSEKAINEFYTEKERLDNDSFINLGVVKNSKKRSIEEVDEIIDQLRELFESQNVSISEIIEVLKDYLPNLENPEPEKGCVIPNKIIN